MVPLLIELRGRIENILRPDSRCDDRVKEVALELAKLYNACEWAELRNLVQAWNETEMAPYKGLRDYTVDASAS
jgi:hypothetical protein